MFGSDGQLRVLRNSKEEYISQRVNPTVKHGDGSMMVWGCMATSAVCNLHFIEGIMNSEVYKEMMTTQMIPSAKLLGFCCILQQDAKNVRAFLAKKKVKVLEWPPQCPDLNLVKHL